MKLVTLTGVLLSLAAVTASAALAGGSFPVRPDDRPVHGVESAVVADAPSVRPDDRSGVRGVGATIVHDATAVRPDDRVGPRGVGAASVVASTGRPDGRLVPDGADITGSRPTLVLVDGDGFDWGDATVGAFSAFGFVLLAIGLALATRRTRRGGHVTA